MPISIENAEIIDISEVFNLVKELAKYENALDQITVDLDYYIKSFKENVFKCIVARDDDKIIGTCIYYLTFSTWKGRMMYLEDFVVKEEYRNQGVGQLLYDQFLAIAQQEDCTMVKWQVLDWNEPAIKFYEKNNATIEKEWWNCKVIF